MSIRSKYQAVERQIRSLSTDALDIDWEPFTIWLVEVSSQYSERVKMVGGEDLVQSVLEKVWEHKSDFVGLSLSDQKSFALTVIFKCIRQVICGSAIQAQYEHERWQQLAIKALKDGDEFEDYILERLSVEANIQKAWLSEGFLGAFSWLSNGQETVLSKEQLLLELQIAIEKTTEQEQLFLSLYYEQNMNYAQIGQIVELSGARVCQVMAKALGKIRLHLYKCNLLVV